MRFAGSRVERAEVMLAGFDAQYTDGDHHLLQLVVLPAPPRIENRAEGAIVRVRGELGLRGDGDWAQPFIVRVRCLLICDLAPA